ncbi:MAG: radical SAM protein [Deltaproteobacteria bacterium]|nr:radical SAM protein [Deltaproteobacteria bacterium]
MPISQPPEFQPMAPEIREKYNALRQPGSQDKLCHAPFKNMYIGYGGKVGACTYNRQHFLGNYPRQSLKEIWNGERAEKLRRHVSAWDFSAGCHPCRLHFEGGNLAGVKAKMYDAVPLNPNGYPSVLELELSNACNLQCIQCSGVFSSAIRKFREKKPPIEIPYDEAFLEQMEEFIPHLTEFKFYGGEPFLIEPYYRLWESVARLKPEIRISLQTNATVLNDRAKSIMERTNFHFNISLDSTDKQTFESIRIGARFDKVMENLRYIKDYCKRKETFFGISACVLQENWHDIPKLVDFCNKMDAVIYFHTIAIPTKHALWKLPRSKIEEICRFLDAVSPPSSTELERKNKFSYEHLVSMVHLWKEKAARREEERRMLDEKGMGNMERLVEILRQRILHDQNLSREDKESKISLAEKSIESIFQRLPKDFPVQTAVRKMEDIFEEADTDEFLAEMGNAEGELVLRYIQSDSDGITRFFWEN